MAGDSNISWTDATWPIVAGCSYASPGCSNCWAVRDSWRLAHNPNPKVHNAYFGTVDKTPDGKLVWSGVIRTLDVRLDWPLKWHGFKKVFVCSQSDLFHPLVPFQFVAKVFGVMSACPQHTFQVLTKHPARMREFFRWIEAQQNGALESIAWESRYIVGNLQASEVWPLENVWLGVTVEDQKRADERMYELVEIPAAVHWLSVEPMLEEIDIGWFLRSVVHGQGWVVCGGESAQTRANTRPFHLQWAHDLLTQCRDYRVPFFMKQLGTRPHDVGFDQKDTALEFDLPAGKNARYKWHEPAHWPASLRVQEFPA